MTVTRILNSPAPQTPPNVSRASIQETLDFAYSAPFKFPLGVVWNQLEGNP